MYLHTSDIPCFVWDPWWRAQAYQNKLEAQYRNFRQQTTQHFQVIRVRIFILIMEKMHPINPFFIVICNQPILIALNMKMCFKIKWSNPYSCFLFLKPGILTNFLFLRHNDRSPHKTVDFFPLKGFVVCLKSWQTWLYVRGKSRGSSWEKITLSTIDFTFLAGYLNYLYSASERTQFINRNYSWLMGLSAKPKLNSVLLNPLKSDMFWHRILNTWIYQWYACPVQSFSDLTWWLLE